MDVIGRGEEAQDLSIRRMRSALRFVSIAALIGAGAASVWFGFAATGASGAQMAAASGLFAAVASGWAGAFATIKAKLKSDNSARS